MRLNELIQDLTAKQLILEVRYEEDPPSAARDELMNPNILCVDWFNMKNGWGKRSISKNDVQLLSNHIQIGFFAELEKIKACPTEKNPECFNFNKEWPVRKEIAYEVKIGDAKLKGKFSVDEELIKASSVQELAQEYVIRIYRRPGLEVTASVLEPIKLPE